MRSIFETGLVKNGLLILNYKFFELEKLNEINPLLISGFIQVLNDFIDIEFKDIPEQLKMEKFCAYFYPIMDPNDENNNLIFYVFCRKNVFYHDVKKVFENVELLLDQEIKVLLLTSPKKSVISKSQEILSEEFEKFNRSSSFGKKLSEF